MENQGELQGLKRAKKNLEIELKRTEKELASLDRKYADRYRNGVIETLQWGIQLIDFEIEKANKTVHKIGFKRRAYQHIGRIVCQLQKLLRIRKRRPLQEDALRK